MVKCIRHVNGARVVNGHAFEITKLGIAIRAVGKAAHTINLSLPDSAESIRNDGRLGGTFNGQARQDHQYKNACLHRRGPPRIRFVRSQLINVIPFGFGYQPHHAFTEKPGLGLHTTGKTVAQMNRHDRS